jgi:hypothetical protein
MKLSDSVKDWLKALGLFWAGYLLSVYVVTIAAFVVMRPFGMVRSINWITFLTIPLPITVMAIFSFLIFWGWFRFRTGMKLDVLNWKACALSGFSMIPILTLISLPLIFIGIMAMAPMLFNIVLPVFVILMVSEGASWHARVKARK